MKAIRTKYHGPGNVRGARISADDGDGNRVFISYPYELSGEACHRAAADALCKKMNWPGPLVGGGLKNGYAFCFLEASPEVKGMREALKECITSEGATCFEGGLSHPERMRRRLDTVSRIAGEALQPFTR